MTFASPNKADNITIAVATAFLAKLTKLGFRFGPLHLDDDDIGGFASGATPVSEIPDLDGAQKYNCIVYAGGDWHNVAQMVLMFGEGTLQDFREVFTDVYPNQDPDLALLNIPGAAKAIEKLIEKA